MVTPLARGTHITPSEMSAGEANRRLEDLSRLVGDWLWETDRDQGLVYLSNRVMEILGFHPEELLGKKLEDFGEFASSNGERGKVNWRSPFRDLEFKTENRGGDKKILLISGLPIFDEISGNFTGVMGTARDITKRKNLEDAAKAERELLRDAIESISDGVVLFDKDDRFVLCNNAYRENLEKVQDLLVPGTSIEAIARAAAQKNIISLGEEDIDNFIPERMEKHKSREPILLHFPENDRWVMVYDYQTSDGGSFIVRTDITQQKKIEEELRESQDKFLTAIDNMSDAFALFDANDCLVQCNQKYLDGFASKLQAMIIPGIPFEELVRIAVDNNFYPLDGKTKEEVVQERLAHHRHPKGPLEITRPDGRTFVFNESKIPGGGTVLLRSDITERKKAEDELRESNYLVNLLRETAAQANAATSFEEAIHTCLETVNKFTAWPIGHAYVLSDEEGDLLVPSGIWHLDDPDRFADFVEATEKTSFKSGIGLPGRVFESGKSEWIIDIARDKNFPRKKIVKDINIHGAFAFPVLAAGKIVAVLEFFDIHESDPDESLLPTLLHIGAQLGQVFTRTKAEEAIRESRDELELRVEERTRELQESEERFRAIFDNSPAAILLKDKNGQYLMANKQWHVWFNPEKLDINGKTVFDFFSEEHAKKVAAADTRVVETKRPEELEMETPLADGRALTTIFHKFPVFGSDGEVIAIGGIITDITARIEAEGELKESEGKLREILEKSPFGIAITNHDRDGTQPTGKRLFVNDAFIRMFGGASADEMKKRNIIDSWVDPEQLMHVETVMKARQELVDFEALRRRTDGSEWWVSMNSRPIRFEDHDCTMVWHIDITDRKRADETLKEKVKEHRRAEEALRVSEIHLRSIMENIVEAVITIGEDGSIETFNPAAEDMFGYTPDEVLGENVSILADEPERSEHDHYLQIYLQTKKPAIIGKGFREIRARRKDGSIFPAELAVSEIRRGRNINFIGTLRDATQRKEAEDALRAAKERAEFANRTKTEFLAHMSHELRTPLNAILGYSEILQSEMFGPLGDQKYPEYVKNINNAGTHLLDVLSDILDVSKVEAGELGIDEEEDIDIRAIIMECKTMVQEKADFAKISLSWRAGQDLPLLRADGRRVKQIILNLLSNALNFTPERGKVVIGVQQTENGGIVIKISDTGAGIAKDDIPKILKPFGKVKDAYISNPAEGSGLGLPLVKSLAELHGGSLEIESTPGIGTKVSVIFPPERTIKAE